MQRPAGTWRPEVPPPPRPQPSRERSRWPTAAWVALTVVLLAVAVTAGTLTFLALRDDDDGDGARAPVPEPGTTVAFGVPLSVPGVADVRVLRVERTKRVAPRRRGGRAVAARGVWYVVTVEVTNRTRSDQTVSARVLELEDDRLIYTGGGGTASSQELFLRSALHGRTLKPGERAVGRLAYDVPKDAKPLRLRVPHSWRVLDVDDPAVDVSYAELR